VLARLEHEYVSYQRPHLPETPIQVDRNWWPLSV